MSALKSKSKSLPWDTVEEAVNLDSNHAVQFSILDVGISSRFAQETHRKYHPLAKRPTHGE